MVRSRHKKRTDVRSSDFEHGRKLEYLELAKNGRNYDLNLFDSRIPYSMEFEGASQNKRKIWIDERYTFKP